MKDFKEFVAYAKANQSKMQFGSAGAGSATHLGCVLPELHHRRRHHPRAVSAAPWPALQDLARADGSTMPAQIVTTAKPQVDGGTIKGLAMLDTKRPRRCRICRLRKSRAPATLVAYTWNAIFMPKNTPEAIVKKLNSAMVNAMHSDVAGQARRSRRGDRTGQPDLAGVPRQAGQGRDREVGQADQGQRRVGRLDRKRRLASQ